MVRRFVLLIWVLLPLLAGAQPGPPDAPRPTTNLWDPLPLPEPNAVRTASGEPGPAYWQQRVDYHIRAALDARAGRIEGSETVTYVNHSPDTLRVLWFQLDQNLFASRSRGAALQPSGSRYSGSFDDGGFHLSRIELQSPTGPIRLKPHIEDTRMRLDLPRPLLPYGDSLRLEIDFRFRIPEYGADRMGIYDAEQGPVFQIAQWHPRLFVYDDVHGWDTLPYLGQGEFYLEYGRYDVELTVPHDMIVSATGDLRNAGEVLTPEQNRRLEAARTSEDPVLIIGPKEVGRRETRPAGREPLTWKFRAENVRDFAWAASKAFIWDAAGWNGVLVQSVYPREGLGYREPGWEESTRYARHAIRYYSEKWFPYPYPTAVNVAGVVGGMEYPMIVFCSVHARGEDLFGVTDHEFGHSWFPMIVGSNERRHAWMDEGFDSFMNYYSALAFLGEHARLDPTYSAGFVSSQMAALEDAEPIATAPDDMRGGLIGFLAYRKPAVGLILLREYVLGPERFDRAFREYTHRWAFKHPQPADFFRTMEHVTGEDLDWFWRGWFYTSYTLDQAVTEVETSGPETVVTLTNQEPLVLPLELLVTYTNGSSETLRFPADSWRYSDTFEARLPGEAAEVRLDPRSLLPDINRANNVWKRRSAP